jgi:hypothetical protein
VWIEDPHRFDGVRVIGVDEHCWRHTRRGGKYVTVIIDLTPIRDGTGPARLLSRGSTTAPVLLPPDRYRWTVGCNRTVGRLTALRGSACHLSSYGPGSGRRAMAAVNGNSMMKGPSDVRAGADGWRPCLAALGPSVQPSPSPHRFGGRPPPAASTNFLVTTTRSRLTVAEDVPRAVGFRWGLHDRSYGQALTADGRSSGPGSWAVARSRARASCGSSW